MASSALEREERQAQDAAANRPSVNTFDVFDTLIARRCIEPSRIFEMVAHEAKIENFVAARIAAEQAVAGEPYDLDAIYAALMTLLNLDSAKAAELKTLELAYERENVVPVAENMACVGDGDLLLSDMYLGGDVIRSLLEAAGFTKKVALIVTSNGKQSGRLWPLILDKFSIKEHCGDNPHSDVSMPARFGIACRQTSVTSPNYVERTLLDVGLRDLAMVCRQARLATWNADPDTHALQLIQASLNFPILVLASIALARLIKRQKFSALLFCSRDCNLWLALFRVLARDLGLDCQADYFYTSRLTRTKPSADYLAYAREEIKDGCALVDICGTGWSLAHLCQNLGVSDQSLVFLHRLPSVSLYEQRAPTPPTCTIHALLDGAGDACNHVALEMSNYAEHGMVLDMRRIGNTFVPVFSADQRPAHIRSMIAAQQSCFLQAVSIVGKHGLNETLALDDASLNLLCTALYQGLSNQSQLQIAYGVQHHAEDIATLQQLGCI
jgi:hypothetical protein